MEVSVPISKKVVKTEENIDVEDVDEPAIEPVHEEVFDNRPRRIRRSNPRYAHDSTSGFDQTMEMSFDTELDITDDMSLVQNSSRSFRKPDYGDFGPVEHKFESSQRKRHVIVYNSIKYPGRASEWYFARRNASTENETYRCVTCRRYREDLKRRNNTEAFNRPEARITVHRDRFITDPDDPMGDHICDFANSEKTTLVAVWTKRALSRANSELRVFSTKPRAKFESLLEEIKAGEEYAHLPVEVREKIVYELSAGKGFDARRRSFARNNKIAQTRHLDKEGSVTYVTDPSAPFICGMPKCLARFTNSAVRERHREEAHPDAYFIDSSEDAARYHAMARANNAFLSGDDIVVANEQEIQSEIRVYHRDPNHYEVFQTHDLDREQMRFHDQLDMLLSGIRDQALANINNEERRNECLKHLQDIHAYFDSMNEAIDPVEVAHDQPKRSNDPTPEA